ncbi:TonB-dependent receptor [Dysgonomonas macrotermitis]|uniref:Iron complex outermembrane recepter protein n=1 Tax=Dysgonomonas macrotermitis TaxID=1346286 RepID=A0A1M5EF60_9BACT|nr:TonB-dependent receptor [Dysgonomonas macrotermitis]SHF77869.1 iron complex outermembrane recepter protein [Dysgonomonas macrotermitis]
MKKIIYSVFALLAIGSSTLFAQKTISIKGNIHDHETPLAGAIVRVEGTNINTVTDENGNYEINTAPGTYTLAASYLGYYQKTANVRLEENQDGKQDFELSSKELGEVVVLGSRGGGRSRLETPVPVDVIDGQTLKDVPQVSLTQILNYVVPSFNSNTQVISDGTDHIDPATLRGLGPDQVLVLINGKRRHTTSLININGTVGKGSVGADLNAIPTSAIKRIEVLRDGAAAQYGSDAIAGVINIILEDSTDQLKFNASTGANISRNSEGDIDGERVDVDANYGIKLGDKGGFLNLAGVYNYRKPTNRQKEFTGTIFTDYNRPDLYPNPTGADITDEELARRGETRADYVSRIGQSESRGGALFFNSVIPVKNETEFYAFGGLNYRQGESTAFRRQPAQLTQNISEIYPDGYLPLIVTNNYDKSLATGIRGKVSGWNVDFSNTYGNNKIDFTTENSLNASLGKSSPTSFDAGGYSFTQNTTNLDIDRNFADALSGVNVAFGLEHRYENYIIRQGEESSYRDYGKATQIGTDADGNPIYVSDINGSVQTLFAENGSAYAGGAQAFPGFRPENAVDARRSSFAAYGDVEVNFTPQWLVAGALRFENYSDFGSTLNWKLSTRYKFNDILSVRAAANTGFRAPSLHQRYFSATSSVWTDGVIVQSGTFTNDSRAAKLLGIPKLKEEKSFSVSGGLTANFGKFKATVDGYFIRIDDRIIYTGQFTGSNAAEASAQDKEIYQLLYQVGASSARFFANAIDTETKGIDAVLTYQDQLGKGNLRIDLSGTFSKTNVVGDVHSSTILAGKENSYLDRASRIYIESATPRVKVNLSLNYSLDKWSFLLRNVYFGSTDAATNIEADAQTYDPRIITDLVVGYDFNKNLKLSVGSNNVFDIYPDKNNAGNRGAGYFIYSRTGQQFGFNGRYVFARIGLTI